MGDPAADTAPTTLFLGLALETGPGVLRPRAETELLARIALARLADLPASLVPDIGCGAGTLALALIRLSLDPDPRFRPRGSGAGAA